MTRTKLSAVQRRRKQAFLILGAAIVLALPFFQPIWPDDRPFHEAMETVGLVLIGLAVVGRCWCTLYIGGRKSREIVAVGPYSISRNPLYVASCIGILGVGLQTGSLIIAGMLPVFALAIFIPVILREERALADRFGRDFEDYRARVPRFGPKLSGWTELDVVPAHPRLFLLTTRDAALLFLAAPLSEGIELLQQAAQIAPVLRLA